MTYVSLISLLFFLSFCIWETWSFINRIVAYKAEKKKLESELLEALEKAKSENISLQDQLNVINETIESNHNDNITYLTHEKIIQSKAHELAIKRYNLQEGLNLKTISMKDKALMSILLDRETCKIGQQLKEIKLRKQQSNST